MIMAVVAGCQDCHQEEREAIPVGAALAAATALVAPRAEVVFEVAVPLAEAANPAAEHMARVVALLAVSPAVAVAAEVAEARAVPVRAEVAEGRAATLAVVEGCQDCHLGVQEETSAAMATVAAALRVALMVGTLAVAKWEVAELGVVAGKVLAKAVARKELAIMEVGQQVLHPRHYPIRYLPSRFRLVARVVAATMAMGTADKEELAMAAALMVERAVVTEAAEVVVA